MSTMNPKASSGGEEEASGMRSKTLGESFCLGKVERGQAILVAYLIATLELTFLFMQTGVMPVSMGCPASHLAFNASLCSFPAKSEENLQQETRKCIPT